MQGCGLGPRHQIRVGLQQIGLIGLRESLQEAVNAGLDNRGQVIEFMLKILEPENYIPTKQNDEFLKALWREYKRFIGEDISDFYAEAEVEVCGESGPERDRFVDTLVSVFGDYELHPIITFSVPEIDGIFPQLILDNEPIVQGCIPRNMFKLKVRKYLTHW